MLFVSLLHTQMMFATLKEGTFDTKEETSTLGSQWSSLMKTGGVDVQVYPLEANKLLFTEQNGQVFKVKKFVLEQPEVEKFTWKDQDFFPAATGGEKKDLPTHMKWPGAGKKQGKKKKTKKSKKAKKKQTKKEL